MSTPLPRKRNYNWLAFVFVFSPLIWTIPTFLYLRAETKTKNTQCERQLKSLGTQILEIYAAEHGNRLPDAKSWTASITGKYTGILICPNDHVSHPVSYAMNANLSGKKLSEIKNPANVILLYESSSTQSIPFGAGKDLVDIGKAEAGQGRHNLIGYRFNFFLMADGSIRQAGTLEEKKPLRWTP